MSTLVIGGGVVGVATAYELALGGEDVTLVERDSEIAAGASGVNAGLITPGHSLAWASPQAPGMLARSLIGENTAIRVRPQADPRFLRWGMSFLRQCTPSKFARNTLVKFALASYSQTCIDEVAECEDIEFHQARGLLYLYDDEPSLQAAWRRLGVLHEHGLDQRLLTPQQVAAIEPALAAAADRIAGAVHGPTDGLGDSASFARQLAAAAQTRHGVTSHTGVRITQLVAEGADVVAAVTADGDLLTADRYVVAAGTYTPLLTETIGLRVPIYPAKGYSATFPIVDPTRAPERGGVDESRLVAFSRLGDRLRVTSTAEFSGWSTSWTSAQFAQIREVVHDWFPGAVDVDAGVYAAGLRPVTPDGPPIIDRSPRHRNLWVNAGHGHLGWTMACGSARVLAASVAGESPPTPIEGLGWR